jgi:hypothetical protein
LIRRVAAGRVVAFTPAVAADLLVPQEGLAELDGRRFVLTKLARFGGRGTGT